MKEGRIGSRKPEEGVVVKRVEEAIEVKEEGKVEGKKREEEE